MLRFALTGFVWIACVGSVALYMQVRDKVRLTTSVPTEQTPESAARQYDRELTPTFAAEADPFALVTSDAPAEPAIAVQLNGAQIAALTDGVAPGEPWRKDNITGVVEGANEIIIAATPPIGGLQSRHALRARVLSQGQTIADQTFWTEGGEKIIATLRFDATPTTGDDHDH